MDRILIIGTTGVGKTTLAKEISGRTGLPAYDLDDFYWQPGWVIAPAAEFQKKTVALCAQEKWIITGNYRSVRDIVWSRADTLIWMDYSFLRALLQLLKRTFTRLRDRQMICNGNTEDWRLVFSRRSIILWFFKTYWRRKQEYGAVFKARDVPSVQHYIRLRNPEEAKEFIAKYFSK